jgi:cobalt-precorrin 5A hydrolase / precorrin-3B C17-methyltransferase
VRLVFVALTAEGLETARRAADAVGGEVHDLHADFAGHARGLFEEGTPIVGVCAAGILIRVLAPLLSGKRSDPPVLSMSETGEYVVPLLGGHNGANELAERIAEALGTHAAVTTAGDSRFGLALDRPPEGWTLANPDDAKDVMAALLGGAKARLDGRAKWLEESRIPFAEDGLVRLVVTTQAVGPGREAGPRDSAPPSRNSRASSLREDASNFDLPTRGRLEVRVAGSVPAPCPRVAHHMASKSVG